ncbi:SAM-dependent methyltransferase [Weissella viridescens]|uniref:SAM-dependent methyltransferase n=1 Tax=Weissella viridescens TaxID=1629 RepID=A0A3P2RCV3_WEIVI|nr:SAM-dependent methyltransferase [Weissella viridescens]RRG18569.1 SAM-dependent methyltransferase [Weissella viridescens]
MSEQTLSFGAGRQLEYIDYLDALADFLLIFQKVPTVKQKITLAQHSVEAINKGQYPQTLHDMEISANDILAVQQTILNQFPDQPERGNKIWAEQREALEQVDYCLRNIRDEFIEDFNMYAYLTPDFLTDLSQHLNGRPTLEVMAGQGYLSAGLQALQPEQTIHVTDNRDWVNQPVTAVAPVVPVVAMDACQAIKQYGTDVEVVLMSWAPDTSEIDWEVLQLLRANYPDVEFLVIGEKDGATDSAIFWQNAHLTDLTQINATRPQFDLIDEKIYRVR